MRRDGREARERLLDAAERVFAVQGPDSANLRDINRAAGQSNNSALHYHFGSREKLLTAILARHRPSVEASRTAIIGSWTQEPTIAELLTAIVQPLAQLLATASGRNFLRVLVHLRYPSRYSLAEGFTAGESSNIQGLYDQLSAELQHLPDGVRKDRIATWIDMGISALSGRAESIERGDVQFLPTEDFVVNLVDMGSAALSAPTSLGVTQNGLGAPG